MFKETEAACFNSGEGASIASLSKVKVGDGSFSDASLLLVYSRMCLTPLPFNCGTHGIAVARRGGFKQDLSVAPALEYNSCEAVNSRSNNANLSSFDHPCQMPRGMSTWLSAECYVTLIF